MPARVHGGRFAGMVRDSIPCFRPSLASTIALGWLPWVGWARAIEAGLWTGASVSGRCLQPAHNPALSQVVALAGWSPCMWLVGVCGGWRVSLPAGPASAIAGVVTLFGPVGVPGGLRFLLPAVPRLRRSPRGGCHGGAGRGRSTPGCGQVLRFPGGVFSLPTTRHRATWSPWLGGRRVCGLVGSAVGGGFGFRRSRLRRSWGWSPLFESVGLSGGCGFRFRPFPVSTIASGWLPWWGWARAIDAGLWTGASVSGRCLQPAHNPALSHLVALAGCHDRGGGCLCSGRLPSRVGCVRLSAVSGCDVSQGGSG
jgi:hypothetical protein